MKENTFKWIIGVMLSLILAISTYAWATTVKKDELTNTLKAYVTVEYMKEYVTMTNDIILEKFESIKKSLERIEKKLD